MLTLIVFITVTTAFVVCLYIACHRKIKAYCEERRAYKQRPEAAEVNDAPPNYDELFAITTVANCDTHGRMGARSL